MGQIVHYITSYLSSTQTPGAAGNMFWVLVYILLIFPGLSGAVIAMNWLERKILAHMQVRLGPMRVGPHGLMQPIADAIKLLLKEDIMPAEADAVIFWVAPFVVVLAAFTVFVVVPFGPTHAITDMNIGILFMLGVSSLSVLGIVMAGWASNSHYPLIGALRSSAQMVSYEVAMGLAVVSAILMTSLNATELEPSSMIGIVQAQQAQDEWFIFQILSAWADCLLHLCRRHGRRNQPGPFDLPEAESELTAGFHTEYSGFRWSLFFLAEYSAMIAVSSIAVTLWLGGWLRPFPTWLTESPGTSSFAFPGTYVSCFRGDVFLQHGTHAQASAASGFKLSASRALAWLLGSDRHRLVHSCRSAMRIQDIFWFSAKVAGFMYLYIWYRGTFPRYRFDQLMKWDGRFCCRLDSGVLILTASA